jgi:hypothetical protein
MAFVVGALIIKFREETVHWLTIVIGALFFVTGLISVVLNRQRPTPLPLPVREGSRYSSKRDELMAGHDELAMDFVADDADVVALTDVVHAL